ncbi:MAG: hypothetical protein ABI893_10175 [Polaromonas sp.]|uniref:hypothetical protein n=1 Tax=Polaromonas sp. TaxID=1869339 RepID=UPI0032662184
MAASPVAEPVVVPAGMLLVPVVDDPIEGVLSIGDGVAEGGGVVEGVAAGVDGDEPVAPVSSTFLPQAPKASKAARATAVRAAGLNLDACMSVPFLKINWLNSDWLNVSQNLI